MIKPLYIDQMLVRLVRPISNVKSTLYFVPFELSELFETLGFGVTACASVNISNVANPSEEEFQTLQTLGFTTRTLQIIQ